MMFIVRAIVVLVVFVAAYYFIFWVPLSFLPEAVPMWVGSVISLIGAGAAAVSLLKFL